MIGGVVVCRMDVDEESAEALEEDLTTQLGINGPSK